MLSSLYTPEGPKHNHLHNEKLPKESGQISHLMQHVVHFVLDTQCRNGSCLSLLVPHFGWLPNAPGSLA